MALLLDKDLRVFSSMPPLSAVWVGGVRYRNSAAKFWFGLIDELVEFFPMCDAANLSALFSSKLTRDLLFPEIALQKSLEALETQSLEEVMRDTALALELFGPPSAVRIALMAGDRILQARDLARDCVDAEIFPNLLVWPLEWAHIGESTWNDVHIEGAMDAVDHLRRLRYAVRFVLGNEPIREGLHRRSLMLRFERRRDVTSR